MQAHAFFPQQPGLLPRALDIAREVAAGEVAADHADAAIAQREHEAGADHPIVHAHRIAEIDDHQHDGAGQGPLRQ